MDTIFRADLNDILELALKNNKLILESGRFVEEYTKLLKRITLIVVACHIFHFVNDLCIYTPTRILNVDSFAVASCVGKYLSFSVYNIFIIISSQFKKSLFQMLLKSEKKNREK